MIRNGIISNNIYRNGTKSIGYYRNGIFKSFLQEPTAVITQSFYDTNIIPDKYNTGVDESIALTVISDAGIYDGISYKLSNNNLALDFKYTNTSVDSDVLIENKDFSAKKFISLNNGALATPKTVTFRNCKLAGFVSEFAITENIHFVFENCTIQRLEHSYMIARNCYIGGSVQDGSNPLRDVYFYDCYIADLAHMEEGLETDIIHSDGTQIYGYTGISVQNILFSNCRVEAPQIPYSDVSGVYVNSCFSYALEKSPANGVAFSNCIINGGGYSIYASTNGNHATENVLFENIKIGCSKRWGNVYPNIADGVTLTNIVDQDKLYVGSVWKDGADTHISVSNDTNLEKTLIVVTNLGTTTHTIPKCLLHSEMVEDVTAFEDFPFDIDINVGVVDWVVCYDGAVDGNNHIRFVNWGENQVIL